MGGNNKADLVLAARTIDKWGRNIKETTESERGNIASSPLLTDDYPTLALLALSNFIYTTIHLPYFSKKTNGLISSIPLCRANWSDLTPFQEGITLLPYYAAVLLVAIIILMEFIFTPSKTQSSGSNNSNYKYESCQVYFIVVHPPTPSSQQAPFNSWKPSQSYIPMIIINYLNSTAQSPSKVPPNPGDILPANLKCLLQNLIG